MPPSPPPPDSYRGCLILSTTIQRPSANLRGPIITSSSPELLLVTPTYEQALVEILRFKREIVRTRDDTEDICFCMVRDRIDGLDVVLIPRVGGLTSEVRVRILGVDILGEGQGERVRFGNGDDGKGGGEQETGGDEDASVDKQSGGNQEETGLVEASGVNEVDGVDEESGGDQKEDGVGAEDEHGGSLRWEDDEYPSEVANDKTEVPKTLDNNSTGTRTPHSEGTDTRLQQLNVQRRWSMGIFG